MHYQKEKTQGKGLMTKKILNEFSIKASLNTASIFTGIEAVRLMFQKNNNFMKGVRKYGLGFINNNKLLKSLMIDFASGKLLLPDKYNWKSLDDQV